LVFVFDPGERVAWILRLVKISAEGEGRALDVMEINRPDDLGDVADLGLRLEETKRLLAGLQQEIVATHAGEYDLLALIVADLSEEDLERAPLILTSRPNVAAVNGECN
jgi:hypothetical protein